MKLVYIGLSALLASAALAQPQHRPSPASGGAAFRPPTRGPVGGGGGNRGPVAPPRTTASPRVIIVPLYLGGGGYYYGDPYAQAGPQAGQEPPSVIVNQGYQPQPQNPVVYDYSNAPIPPSPSLEERQSAPPPATIQQAPDDQEPTIFLIASKDGSIVATLGYWVVDDVVHYTDRNGNIGKLPMDRVDREFSTKLNSDRQVEFKLP